MYRCFLIEKISLAKSRGDIFLFYRLYFYQVGVA